MGGGRRTTAALAAPTTFAAVRLRRILHLAMQQQSRHCSSSTTAITSSSSARQKFHYRPHQLSGKGRGSANSGLEASSTMTASSSMQLSLDLLAPPSTLTVDAAVEYMAALRGLHRSLGVAPSSSRVRWQAREFLLRGMPSPNAKESQVIWTLTEELACAIIVSCAYFEVSISECTYGAESIEFLQGIWHTRLQQPSTSLLMCTCDEAVLLGRLTMAVLELLVNRILHVEIDDYELLSKLLCEALLPAVMRVLQDDAIFSSPMAGEGEARSELTAAQATAFTVLLSSLTKAAVTQWARPSGESEGVVLFATPADLPRLLEDAPRLPHAVQVAVPALPPAKLARVVFNYASGLTPSQVRESALPLLRFFTLTQCVPLFVAPHDACVQYDGDNDSNGGDAQETHTASLVKSITRVLQASLEHRTVFVSHQVANITSIYARILLFSPRDPEKEVGRDGTALVVASASWLMFESLMMGLRRNILYHVGPLSPIVVMPQLCECVTLFARKYLFSDMAALLNALSKIFRVVCEHHSHMGTRQRQRQQHVRLDKGNAVGSRFERRRTTASAVITNDASADAGHLSTAPSSPLPPSLLTGAFFVGNDDIAEIEGELEVLLDACVAVMERHLLASCNSRQVFVAKSSVHPLAAHLSSRDGGSTVVREETGVALAGVGASQAKTLGGRSRRLKRTVSSRELVMIAEGVHALSWRPFMAFQERLLTLLSSHVGQMEATPFEYACLVRFVLRAPPVPPSVIFHSVGDRLKRLIHAEAVTVVSSKGEGCGDVQQSIAIVASAEEKGEAASSRARVVIAAAHARSLCDTPLALYDACAVVFAFAQKLKKSALPLLHDLLVRCGQRVTSASESPPGLCNDSATSAALAMFVASATWVLHHATPISSEDHALTFIAASRDHAAHILAARTSEEASHAATAFLPFRELAYACMMLEFSCDSRCEAPLTQLRRALREAYMACGSRCDSMEVAQFLADYLAIPSLAMSYGDSVTAPNAGREGAALLQLSPWMIHSLQLRQRLASNTRLPLVMFTPFLGDGSDKVTRILHVTRLYCRTFATLVTTLRLLRAANVELLREDAVLEVVLRKVAQLTRRTARPLELFQFFELYGDCPQVVAACLSELLPEARCFGAVNAFVPIVQVNAAVRAVRRLQLRELRRRWFAAMTPLIVYAVSSSREPLDVVLELTECIGNDDPELLQSVLKSSASMQMIHETFSYTVAGDVLLRLLLQLQNANAAHPTVRCLHVAARKLLQRSNIYIPLEQLAQAMLLPSLEGTTLGRRLKKLFVFRVTTLLGLTRSRASHGKGLPETKCNEGRPTTTERHSHWDESLNHLELEHWMTFLRFSHLGEPSSHRLVMTIKRDREAAAHRKGKSTGSASANGENASAAAAAATVSCGEGAALPIGEKPEEHAGSNEVGETDDRRYRSLAYFYAFSDHTILCLRRSLGAFHFIAFVCELLRQALCLPPVAASVRESASEECRFMYDGSASPLSDERVWPFVRLAAGLVDEMSADLGGFLRREPEERRRLRHCEGENAPTGSMEEGAEVVLNVGAVLEFLRLLDIYDPLRRERRLLPPLPQPSFPTWSPQSSLSCAALNVFDDTVQIPQRHLYRVLLQVPQYWGKVTPSATPADTPRVRLQNISSVFDYCSAPTEFDLPFGPSDTSMEAHRCLSNIFGADRPLITDVWLPLTALQSQQQWIDRCVKGLLFEALMRCLVRDGEALAATRTRFAALGPRDLACVAQTCLRGDTWNAMGNDGHNCRDGDARRRSREAEAVSALELLTDMLPSATAEDIHDIVVVLLPPPSAGVRRHGGDGSASCAPLHGELAEVRRFLAHVAVVMGNDTERFPLPLLYSILLRLHEPHRLIAPAAAQMMLANLHASDDAIKQQPPLENEDEAEAEAERGDGEHVLEETVGGPSRHRCHTATIALLRSVVSSTSSWP
ncbi:hypothetical protein TRSC58_05284 [Trypanosoma rangeli SC58]|uniref:Uncharacterized protein n=1 Tax=Trypanosoma rangeli SC58 TaxID=429131 RepID=A0A061IV76_TRYRA|nr:hypothetical protein TRSC58_05284 [Trypanosoma rangeli SC58]